MLELTNEKRKLLKTIALQQEVTNPCHLSVVQQRTQPCDHARAELTKAHCNFNNSAGSVLKKIVAGFSVRTVFFVSTMPQFSVDIPWSADKSCMPSLCVLGSTYLFGRRRAGVDILGIAECRAQLF